MREKKREVPEEKQPQPKAPKAPKNQGWEGPGDKALNGVPEEILDYYCDLIARRVNYKEAHARIHEEFATELVGSRRYAYSTWRRFAMATDLGKRKIALARQRIQSEVKERSYADPYLRLDTLIEHAERMVELNRDLNLEETKPVDIVRFSKELRECFGAVRDEVTRLLHDELKRDALNDAIAAGDQEALERINKLKRLSNVDAYPDHVRDALKSVLMTEPKREQ